MIESGENHFNVRFTRDAIKAVTLNTDPRFKTFKPIDDNLALHFLNKSSVDLRRNWAIGFSILEISKFVMSSLYYKAIRPAFHNRVSVLFSDTGTYDFIF